MLALFAKHCEHLKRNQNYKVWQEGNMAKVIVSNHFFYQKLQYIHHNPVADMIVQNPEDYLFSSATNYADMKHPCFCKHKHDSNKIHNMGVPSYL
jgi:putative transposase